MTASTIERRITAPGKTHNTSGRPVTGPRRYLVVNGEMVDVSNGGGADSSEAFTVHPAIETAYEYLTTHHSTVNAATIMVVLREMADAIQHDATVAVREALSGRMVQMPDGLAFGNPPNPRPLHITER